MERLVECPCDGGLAAAAGPDDHRHILRSRWSEPDDRPSCEEHEVTNSQSAQEHRSTLWGGL